MLCKQEYPNSDRWHPHKKRGTVAHTCHPRAGRQRQEDLWEIARPVRLVEPESSRFSERFKEEVMEDVDLWPPPPPPRLGTNLLHHHRSLYTHTHTHIKAKGGQLLLPPGNQVTA